MDQWEREYDARGGGERRIDPSDGVAYTKQEYLDFLGVEVGEAAWAVAEVSPVRGSSQRGGGATAPVVRDAASMQPAQPFPYLCVCDFEATCEEDISFHEYTHEIIEFPVVVIDLSNGGAVLREFHSFVRPTENATLSPFCKRLTGITQEQVDRAPTLTEVLYQFEEWRLALGLAYTESEKNFAFGTDGPWDLRYFLHGECTRKGIAKLPYFDKWCNLKELFSDFYKVGPCKVEAMLKLQGMEFEGRLHSGIDDTRNIARIAARMREDGATIYVSEVLPKSMRSGGVFASRTVPFSKYTQSVEW